MNTIRLAIAGCTGRMGRTLVRLAAGEPALAVVAAVTIPDDPLLGQDAGRVAGVNDLGVAIGTEVTVPRDALVEFTMPAGSLAWAKWCADHGVALVSGTTGLEAAHHAALRAAGRRVPVLWAPNMSVGVNLLLAVVEEVAAKLDVSWDVELTETHHRRKVDAPSGTARALLEAVCRGRGQTPEQAAVYGRQGQCGPRPAGQIGVHALRMGEIVGEHEVHFASDAESLTLGHRAYSRDTFAAGALRAVRWLHGRPAGLYTMRDVLFG